MDELKYELIIKTLIKLGYTKKEIQEGINGLNEDKYVEVSCGEIIQDIIKNIEQGEQHE